MRSKRLIVTAVVGVMIVVGLVVFVYDNYWSAPALVRKVADEFIEAAIHGDQAGIQLFLADDAEITADQAMGLFGSLDKVEVSATVEFGVQGEERSYLALVGGYSPSGYVEQTLLLIKSEDGQWVVANAGQSLTH